MDASTVVDLALLERLRTSIWSEGVVSRAQFEAAEARARTENASLTAVLVRSGYVDEERLSRFLGDKLRIPYVNIKNYKVDGAAVRLVPEALARRHQIVPLFYIEGVLTVAMSDPLDFGALDALAAVTDALVETVISSREGVAAVIDQWYGPDAAHREDVDALVAELEALRGEWEAQPDDPGTEAPEPVENGDSPVARLVNGIIAQAMAERASDVHLEPKRGGMQVRLRIDGQMYERQRIPARLVRPIVSRIKVLSHLDIGERRVPQDGRATLRVRDWLVDIRVSTLPTLYGENCVLRLLDRGKPVPRLEDLGFSGDDLEVFRRVIRSTRGIVLATGPTGSGKTTTIYSAVAAINTPDRNIMTIENPIEYEFEGVVQSQVRDGAGVRFASALRAILRQDPDVIYVGEVRDAETAEVAARAATTGHLVFSTLHTGDAAATVTRLAGLGIDPGLIATVLRCAFAQRLVRRLCDKCKAPCDPGPEPAGAHGPADGARPYRPVGCPACGGIGYRGRVPLFEIMVVGPELRRLIAAGAGEEEIAEAARRLGMRTIAEDGAIKVAQGLTSREEVERVTGPGD